MDKLERLLTLLLVLLETPRPLGADELRQRVPGYQGIEADAAFHRAFERDKDSLREMGVPLRLEPVPGADPPREGYRVPPEEYYLRDPGLAPDELAALHLAASTVRLDGIAGMEGLWKLGGVVGDAPASRTTAALPGDRRLGVLFEAVSGRSVLSFRYNDRDREVEPYRLSISRGRWYLSGHDRSRPERAVANFRVDRIDGEVSAGPPGAYAVPDDLGDLDRQPWQYGDEAPITARVAVDAPQAPWAAEHLGEEAVERRHPDGSVVVRLQVSNRAAFRSFVLTFLEHAEVLEPPELRDDVVAFLGTVP